MRLLTELAEEHRRGFPGYLPYSEGALGEWLARTYPRIETVHVDPPEEADDAWGHLDIQYAHPEVSKFVWESDDIEIVDRADQEER